MKWLRAAWSELIVNNWRVIQAREFQLLKFRITWARVIPTKVFRNVLTNEKDPKIISKLCERCKISQQASSFFLSFFFSLSLSLEEKNGRKRGVCLAKDFTSQSSRVIYKEALHLYSLITLIILSTNSPLRTYSIRFSSYRAALESERGNLRNDGRRKWHRATIPSWMPSEFFSLVEKDIVEVAFTERISWFRKSCIN